MRKEKSRLCSVNTMMVKILLLLLATLTKELRQCSGFVPTRWKRALQRRRPVSSKLSLRSSPETETQETILSVVPVLPAGEPLSSFVSEKKFSILSWNVLLPNSRDNWWNHKMYAPWVDMDHRQWPHRQSLIRERLLRAKPDIICIQEADGDTFEDDFAFLLQSRGGEYQHVLHKKYRFRCATFFNPQKFELEREAHKDRTLVTTFRTRSDGNSGGESNGRLLTIVNCHLTGGAAPQRRLRQVHEALEQIRKWKAKAQQTVDRQKKANRPNPRSIAEAEKQSQLEEESGVIVCGDFNSDGDTGVRRLLVDGVVNPDWREPQYPAVPLTSKPRQNSVGTFCDAAELAYAANVCDGDYGEEPALGCRPATYVVPNLASLLLLPTSCETVLRTQFGLQVARGLADTLRLQEFCEQEVDKAFESIDLDGNDRIDKEEVEELLVSVYLATHDRLPDDQERNHFLETFWDSKSSSLSSNGRRSTGLSRGELSEKLLAPQQELEGGSEGAELVEIRTEADAQRMINRFTPLLQFALDQVFEKFSSDGESLTEEEVEQFLLITNGELGRGGTYRHTQAMFQQKKEARSSISSIPVALTREEWYGVFARELGEGKWWQVVYDVETCGVDLRLKSRPLHYQGWLDYVYFDSKRLSCKGVQDALTCDELSKIYDDGDALPNSWYASDHTPVAAVFSW